MKRLGIGVLVGTALLLLIVGVQSPAQADKGGKSLKANLVGFEEPPAVSSTGSGTFRAKIAHDDSSFEYELSYEDLEGVVTQSHIHIGQKGVNGGITIWLCGTTPPFLGPPGTPTCLGPNSGSASGIVTAANVIAIPAQGVAALEFEEVLHAMREGVTYANVHSTKHPGGEIRGQIK